MKLFFVYILIFLHVVVESQAYTNLKRRLEASEECRYALQMLFLQDTTHSFTNDWPTLQQLLPPFVDDLTTRFPGSESALAFFSDVPMPDLGWHFWDPVDTCFDLQLPFPSTVVNVSFSEHTFVDFKEALDHPPILSGRDDKEAQLTALHHATKKSYFPSQQYTLEGHPFVRVVVVSTDSRYHVEGDAMKMLLKHPDMRLDPRTSWYMPSTNFTVIPNDGDENLLCGGSKIEDYPSVEQVAEAIMETEALVMFLVTDNVFSHYAHLADELAVYGVTSIVVLVKADASNIVDSLETGLSKVQDLTCRGDNTSTSTANPHTDETHYIATTSTTAPPEEEVPMAVIVGAAVGGTAAVAAAAGAAYAAKAGLFAGAGSAPTVPVESLEATDFSHHMEPRTVYQNVELDMYA